MTNHKASSNTKTNDQDPSLEMAALSNVEESRDTHSEYDLPKKDSIIPNEAPIVFEKTVSVDRQRREISAGILSETRRKILELALLLDKGEVTEEILESTKSSLAAISAEIEQRRNQDELFNFPLLDQNLRIVFEDLPLLFEGDDEVQKALEVLQRTFRQKYNLVVIVDSSRRAIGIVSSAVLINSDPDALLKSVPTIKNGFAITLKTKPSEVAGMMDHLGVNALPVVDENGIVTGIFTLKDHTQGSAALYSKKLKTEMETHARLGGFQKDIEGAGA